MLLILQLYRANSPTQDPGLKHGLRKFEMVGSIVGLTCVLSMGFSTALRNSNCTLYKTCFQIIAIPLLFWRDPVSIMVFILFHFYLLAKG